MNRGAIVSMFLQQVWHIEPQRAKSLLPLVVSFLEGKLNPENFKSELKPRFLKPSAAMQPGIAAELPAATEQGLIAVIPVSGVMVKYSPWWNPGSMKDIATWFGEAAMSENVDAIILHIDSPGGMVDGTQELVDLFAACEKPVISFIDGCMASAAYLVGCTAKEIIAMNDTCMVGSIGTMWSSLDIIPLLEKFGAKYYEAYADASTQKNAEWRQMEKGNDKLLKENLLNPINDNFIATVKKYRGDKINSGVLSGPIMLAQLALRNGLIDAIGGFDTAVKRARELAAEQKKTAGALTKTDDTNMKIGKTLSGFFSKLFSKQVNEDDELTQEHVTAMENVAAENDSLKEKATQLQGETDALKAQVTQLQQELTASQSQTAASGESLSAMTKERDEWKAKAEKYGATDGAAAGKEVKGEKDAIEEKKEEVLPSMKVMEKHFKLD